MTNHRLTMFQIKSELMDLWTEKVAFQSYHKWFESLQPMLKLHFDIENADFFLYEHNGFVQVDKKNSLLNKGNHIHFDASLLEKEFDRASLINKFERHGFIYIDDIFFFYATDSQLLGVLIVKSTDKWRQFASTPYLSELAVVIANLIEIVRERIFLVRKEENHRRLFMITELFNSTMEVNVILNGIVDSVSELLPSFQVDLLLSHEQKGLTQDYKLFDYMNERPSTLEAFLSGELTIEQDVALGTSVINSPIKGRQGIYGVLQIQAPLDYSLTEMQFNFIGMVTNTAGNALENANLYDQSRRINEDLQMINETSKELNSNIGIDEMTLLLKQRIHQTMKPNEIAFVFFNEINQYDVSQNSSRFFQTKSSERYIDHASSYFLTKKDSLFDADFGDTCKDVVEFQSLIAVPITNQENVVGFVILLHEKRYNFSFESFKLLNSLIAHSSLAITNSMLRDQLQGLVDKDHLTKLYTRSYLDRVVEKSLSKNESGVFILLDVDDFKKVNDTYGHATGDAVLKQIADTIRVEVGTKGHAARWGGEEIAIYLPFANENNGLAFSEMLLTNIPSITKPKVTVSIGMKIWKKYETKQPITFKELFQETDEALYLAKNNGKNRIVIHGTVSAIY